MISTVSQAKYLAHRLTKESKFGEIEKLIPVYLKSGIEVYPHQIAAAYFAVSNPFSKGFILCDEVGLGKAIEAMLVIAQYYYSGRNKIAVVVPPLLIPQWQRLISDKFDLPCKVIEKDFRSEINDEIVLISYTQAAEECESLSKIKWDLAVFEEAHRLRKYYTGENRTATNLHNAFDGVQKLLLTATPMQVNVMDLYGLVNFIDDTVFTDERAFYKRYYKKPENYKELRERLMPFTFRTLRNQVRGDVKLPDRVIHTQEYELNENEKKLLELLSKYVDKPKKLAFPDMDTYELNLMLFKLFSSSIYALSKTLSGVFFRLNQMGNAEAIEEAKEIKIMLDLATSIVYCGHCGDIYRRVHWNNRGYKSIVWRCVSRLEEKGSECTAPTINEETLQTAVVKAINELLANKESFLSTLQKNIATVFNEENDNATDDIDGKLEELQQQLLIQAKSKNDYEDVADEIYRLRELKQNALAENAEREGKRQRIAEMTDFLNEQSCELEEYDEQLVRRLIEKVTVFDDKLTVEFKSGVEIDIEI